CCGDSSLLKAACQRTITSYLDMPKYSTAFADNQRIFRGDAPQFFSRLTYPFSLSVLFLFLKLRMLRQVTVNGVPQGFLGYPDMVGLFSVQFVVDSTETQHDVVGAIPLTINLRAAAGAEKALFAR